MKTKKNIKQTPKQKTLKQDEKGSLELIVIGLLAALIIVLAVPFLSDLGKTTQKSLSTMNAAM